MVIKYWKPILAYSDGHRSGGIGRKQKRADAVTVAGILDVDEDVILVWREHRFDQMADCRPEWPNTGGEALDDVEED